ncbi:MAG: hypothetical protein JSS04_05815 [Proteobacteria bacterium]|nr:hypothetical protein [Pseudomonadota bacterium]
MIPPIGRPQILGIAAVLAAFLLVALVVEEQDEAPAVLSDEAPIATNR